MLLGCPFSRQYKSGLLKGLKLFLQTYSFCFLFGYLIESVLALQVYLASKLSVFRLLFLIYSRVL